MYEQVEIGDTYARKEVIGKIQGDGQYFLVFEQYVNKQENWWARLVFIG